MRNIDKIINYFKQLTHYFSASLIPMLLNLLINPLVSVSMDPEDFAIVGYFTSFSTLIAPIVAFYMIHYYNKRYFEIEEHEREHLRAVLYKALIFFSFPVTIVCILLLLIYMQFSVEVSFKTFPYLYLALMTIPFTGIYNLELADYKMKRKSKEYLKLSMIKGIGIVVMVLLLVVLLKYGAIGKLLATLILDVGVFVYILLKHKDIWQIKTNIKEIYPVLKFCWPLALGAALGYFSNGYDKAVLESLGDVTEFGYYCVGLSIAGYLSVFTASISSTFQPDTYEAIINDDKKRILRVVAIRFILTLFVVIVFILFCPLVVRILTAGKYMDSVPYARIAAFVALSSSLYYIINDYSIARGKPQLYLITTIIGSMMIFILMPIFVRAYSFRGGAIMNVLSYIVLFVINLVLLQFNKRRNEDIMDH